MLSNHRNSALMCKFVTFRYKIFLSNPVLVINNRINLLYNAAEVLHHRKADYL